MSSHQASSPTSERSSEGFSIKRSFSSSPAHRSTKCELLDSIPKDDEFAQKQAQRKRGRPRLDRGALTATERTATSRNARCQRLPHNQVERKYREGLNAELEKLRRAVPTLTQHNPTDMTTLPRPSKATVLACAVEYIKKVEIERDFLRVENETLRGLRPSIAEV
ncbi:hypothetical protein COCMIDRAFT_107638 [Bipolaris oryzae ATCC 44560]|uniref:BHLH domain-containing protein n=1 Tax=Bipolaris oryzae ATCC 44560 TaxID=930090 RepID=W6ZAX1_COCMI|nr:uncharacterized protein COCMIDRAFT_107638 [Bipolaris oryzae ATCC 44560]EUC40876.1 hypothetical protein COCMIDRAFT_107638 [Bipolaris oryzae ATCC 44560]